MHLPMQQTTSDAKRVRRRVTAIVATLLSVSIAEALTRTIDGESLARLTLSSAPTGPPLDPVWATVADRPYVHTWPLADGVQMDWYDRDPSPRPRFAMPPSLRARYERYRRDPEGALAEWNAVYLQRELCAGVTRGSLGILSDFLTFRALDGGAYPTVRHLRHVSPPGSFTTNNFGWRGPDVTLNKPAGTIRLAFVGASTTVDDYSFPFSHTEYLQTWLNLWSEATRRDVRFEVINAGRTGIDSSSIAAIVRDEVMPVGPDAILYYEGANEFAPAAVLRFPTESTKPTRPLATFRQRTRVEQYSALARRLFIAIDGVRWRSGEEPPKPRYEVDWPSAIDEMTPDPFAPSLPMQLDRVVANLETIQRASVSAGAELIVATFLWLVEPGMRLDVRKHLPLFRYLNDTYYPVDYAVMRRMADFQNRVLKRYAAARHLALIDFDRQFPHDPDLFSDAIHLTDRGVRLEAWFYLQALVPAIAERLDQGAWPRPMRHPPPVHPAFVQEAALVGREQLLANCAP
jgi:hypothetical protein